MTTNREDYIDRNDLLAWLYVARRELMWTRAENTSKKNAIAGGLAVVNQTIDVIKFLPAVGKDTPTPQSESPLVMNS